MLANGAAILADENAIGIGMDLHRSAHSTGRHRVLVVIKAHQAGLGDRSRHGMEAVKASGVGNQVRSLALEDLPHCLLRQLRMAMDLGVGDALVQQPGVHLRVALEPQSRGEEALADHPDLVLDLTLLPPRRRRAGGRIDQIVAAHLQEAAVIAALLADEDRLHRRLHVVVNAAPARAPEERERALVGVEYHLLGLARVGVHEHHAAIAKPHMRDLHLHGHAVEQDDLVAPVELVGFPGGKTQRHECRGHRLAALLAPPARIAAYRVIAACVPALAELFKDTDQRQLFAGRLARIGRAADPPDRSSTGPTLAAAVPPARTRTPSPPSAALYALCCAIPSGPGRSP